MSAQEYEHCLHEIGQQAVALLENLIHPQAGDEVLSNCNKAKLKFF
jgi:hypothetical protein